MKPPLKLATEGNNQKIVLIKEEKHLKNSV
jgi:hypothetical protein